MQGWIGSHPILFVVSDVLLLYLVVSLLVSRWSGWATLARRFPVTSEFTGPRWRFQSAQMRWLCGYNNCLTIGANSEGLYLSTLPFFPPFHPPLLIPWGEVSAEKKDLLFTAGLRFELGRENPIPLWVRKRLAERLKLAAGGSYPVESVG